METDWSVPKALFVKHYGSAVQMHRGGVYAQYKQWDVPQELEQTWMEERIGQLTSALSIMNWDAVDELTSIARYHANPLIIAAITAFASRQLTSADSMVRLVYAERLIELIKRYESIIPVDELRESYQLTMNLLEDVVTKPLVLDPGHELQQYGLKDKRGLNLRVEKNREEIIRYFRN
jgi:GR25 family glycosyltransferase involved in LPS biosynthesis